MKNIILSTLAAAAIIVTGAGVGTYIHNQQNKQTQQELSQLDKLEKRVAEAEKLTTTKYNSLLGQYGSLLSECEKGKTFYDSQPVAVKAKTTAPVCNAAH